MIFASPQAWSFISNGAHARGHLSFPVFVVAQEELLVPKIERGGQKKTCHTGVSHFLKAAICRVHATADNSKSASRHLLAQVVVLGKVNADVEPSQLIETLSVE